MNRLFAFALCCAVAFSLTARDVYVAIDDPNAADDTAVGRGGVDLPYGSIQAAVNAADTNDTVLVKPGYYTNNYAISSTSYLPGRQRNRVVLTKNLTLRSTEGKEKTFIVGHWRDGADVNDSTWNPGTTPYVVGIHAVRCVFVEPEASGSIIKGFTLTHGATDNSVAASDAGGGFAAPGGGYLVDCEISHCAGYGAAAVYGGTLVRCVSKDFWPYSGSGYIYESVRMLNCAIFHWDRDSTGAGSVLMKNSTCVNCTILGGNFNLGYKDCALYNVLSANLYSTYFADTDSGTVTRANTLSNNDVKSLPGNDIKYYHCSNPFIGDFRLMSHSAAIGYGDAKWLVGPSAIITLPSAISFTDMNGNDLSEVSGSVNAGCSQTVGDPLYGGIRLNGRAAVLGGVDLKAHQYLFATDWPCVWSLSNNVTVSSTLFSRTDMLDPSVSHDMLFPTDAKGTFLAMPPKTSRRLLSYWQQTAHQRLWVDPVNGNDETGDGKVNNPYRTLYTAGTNSQAYNIDGYNTIFELRPGIYKEGGYVDANGVENRMYMKQWGSSRFVVRAIEGPGTVTIVGSTNGTDNVRCIYALQPGALIDVTLANGRTAGTAANGTSPLSNAAILGGSVQLTGCVVSNCVSSNGIASCYAFRTRFIDNVCSNNVLSTASFKAGYCEFIRNRVNGATIISGAGNPPLFNMAFYGNIIENPGSDMGVSFVVGRNGYPCNSLIEANGARYTSYSPSRAPNLIWNATIPVTLPACDTIADPLFADPENGDLRVLAVSPAVGAAEIASTANHMARYEDYATLDIDGKALEFLPGGRATMGPHQSVVRCALIVEPAGGGIAFTGASIGVNTVEDGDSLTVTAAYAPGGSRNCLGVIATTPDGVSTTNLFAELPGGVWTHTVDSAVTSVRVEAFYSTDWYVDAEYGNDAYDGFSPETAKKTLADVMTNTCLQTGAVIHAAPGRYDEGVMREVDHSVVLNRVIVPSHITLKADKGRDVTFIVGETAPSPDGNGLGDDAVRCVLLQPYAHIEGFTLTGGRTALNYTSGNGHDDISGGVYVNYIDSERGRTDATVTDCDITNCVAQSVSAVRYGLYKRCRFLDNGHSGDILTDRGHYVNCLFRGARFCGVFGYYAKVYNSTIRGYWDAGAIRSSDFGEYYNTIIIGRHSAAGNTFHGCVFATNTLYVSSDANGAQKHPENYPDCTMTDIDSLKLADDLGLTDEPGVQADIALDAYQPPAVIASDTDLAGAPRVMNRICDAGCYEWDIRSGLKAVLGRRVASVDYISSNVVESVEGVKLEGDGAKLVATLPGWAPNELTLRLPIRVVGAGTLTVRLNGEVVGSCTEGSSEIAIRFTAEAAELTFEFSGEGAAYLQQVKGDRGAMLLLF